MTQKKKIEDYKDLPEALLLNIANKEGPFSEVYFKFIKYDYQLVYEEQEIIDFLLARQFIKKMVKDKNFQYYGLDCGFVQWLNDYEKSHNKQNHQNFGLSGKKEKNE